MKIVATMAFPGSNSNSRDHSINPHLQIIRQILHQSLRVIVFWVKPLHREAQLSAADDFCRKRSSGPASFFARRRDGNITLVTEKPRNLAP